MDAEFFGALFLQDAESLKNLFCGHAIFGISRIIHDPVADLKNTAGIVTAADPFGNGADGVFQKLNVGNVI